MLKQAKGKKEMKNFKSYALYVRQGLYLKKQGGIGLDEILSVKKERDNVVVLSTHLSFMVFPELISLRTGEIFEFGIELNKVDPKFLPPNHLTEKKEICLAGGWEAP